MKTMTLACCFLLSTLSLFGNPEISASPIPHHTYALVVGVSNYQDAEIPDLKYAQRDAEAFAAFLQSKPGGGVPKENIKLLTNSGATNAKLGAALDWLFEQSILAEKVIVYLAGYGDTEVSGKETPKYFLLADSPLTPLQAGAFEIGQIAQVLDNIFYKKSPNFFFVANLSPLILPPGIGYQPVKMKAGGKPVFPNSMSRKFIEPTDLKKPPEEIYRAKFTLNHLLLDGLLGFADKDGDGEVSFWEMKKFFRNAAAAEQRWPGLLFLAVGMRRQYLADVDAATLKKLQLHKDGLFPSIVHLETSQREDEILEKVPEPLRLMYQDFILAVKLGQLLEPEDRCASFFYEKLKAEKQLEKLHSDMRRKLAAALQDEVQQALNAYLKIDHSELQRRDKAIEPYQRYADYMARSIELFGHRNFMKNIMQAKYHYFAGLVARMEAVADHRPELFDLAIAEQQKALAYESAAAFIYNELGVVYSLKDELEEAGQQFELALEHSPNWAIPYSNLCIIWTKKGDYGKAIFYGKEAFRRSPKNELVTGTLANAYQRSGDLYAAAKFLEIILQKNPNHSASLYDMACIRSQHGNLEEAFDLLGRALQNGFTDYQWMRQDPDLLSLRERTEQWNDLMKKHFPKQHKK